MKPRPRYSPVWTVHFALVLVLLTAGLAVSVDDKTTVRLTTMWVIGTLFGAWIPVRLFLKNSVLVTAWEVKGPGAVVLAGLGALLCLVSAYSLLMGVLH